MTLQISNLIVLLSGTSFLAYSNASRVVIGNGGYYGERRSQRLATPPSPDELPVPARSSRVHLPGPVTRLASLATTHRGYTYASPQSGSTHGQGQHASYVNSISSNSLALPLPRRATGLYHERQSLRQLSLPSPALALGSAPVASKHHLISTSSRRPYQRLTAYRLATVGQSEAGLQRGSRYVGLPSAVSRYPNNRTPTTAAEYY